jgi:AcrR family transcriptional regulator
MNHQDPVRSRLLAVAEDLFSRRGYEGVSIRAIAAKAKANLGAVTYHFGTKEALYHAAFETISEPFAELIASAARAPGTGLDRVVAVVRAALSTVPQRGGAVTCLLRELANDGPLPPPMLKLMQRNVSTIRGLIEAGQQDGSIREGDATLLALSAISQPFYFKVAGRGLEQALGVRRDDPAQWTRVVEHVAQSVRRTIAREGHA